MKSVNLIRSDTATDPPGAYRMDLTIDSPNDITGYLFVKERITNADSTTNDVFVTVANAVDIEDYAEGAPAEGDVYFRDITVSLVSSDPQMLNDIFEEVLQLLQVVCQQMTDLEANAVAATWIINKDGATLDIP